MDLLLLVAKYGVITATFLVVASFASKELSLLFARIRKQSKFVQLCVFAFIMTDALQLDGNPCIPNSNFAPTNLDRPCLYQGDYLNKYLERRPIIQPEKEE